MNSNANIKPLAQPDALIGWMDSLGDPTRLRLLRLLESHELGVDELREILQLPQSTVSRHLKILADQGFVRSRREATAHLYRTLLDELAPPARKLWLLTREQTEDWATVRQDELRLQRRLREKQQGSQEFFAGAASEWDQLKTELYGQSFTLSAILSLLPSDYIVADLGCGTGELSAILAPHVKEVIAVDNSPAMLKAARKRTADLPNVSLRRGDLQALPIDDASCDAALCLLVLTYLPDPAAAIREIARILKPTGRAIVIDLLPHDRDDFRRQMNQQHMGFSPETLAGLFTANGLTPPTITPLPPDPNTKGPALFLATSSRAPI